MASYPNRHQIPYAPTDPGDIYPDTDGKPMAASDLHRLRLTRTLRVIDGYFAQNPGIYVSGDILMYYEEGNPRRVISPDVLVTFGMGKKLRRTYKVWEEGKTPDFVMEFSSKSTYQNDLTGKLETYARLGIPDYLLYDAEALYLPSPMMGFQLVDGTYVEIPPDAEGGIHSAVLGLDFYALPDGLGIYKPGADEWLQTPEEAAEARAEQEAAARQKAEAEIAQLREEIARLKART